MRHLPHDVLPTPLQFFAEMNEETPRSEVFDLFLRSKEKILKEWDRYHEEESDGDRRRSPDESAITFLKKNVYRVGIHLIETEQLDVLRQLFPREASGKNSVPTVEENPFYWIFRYYFADRPKDMSVQVRNRISKQLNYAYRHRIPPYLLVGFLYILKDPEKISEKEGDPEYVEKWFSRLFEDGDFEQGSELNSDGRYFASHYK